MKIILFAVTLVFRWSYTGGASSVTMTWTSTNSVSEETTVDDVTTARHNTDPATSTHVVSEETTAVQCYNTAIHKAYIGRYDKTVNGTTCQRWDSQSPHSHSRNDPDDFPDVTLEDAGNYCRDPDDEGFLWCYTMENNTRFETCGMSSCSGSDSVTKPAILSSVSTETTVDVTTTQPTTYTAATATITSTAENKIVGCTLNEFTCKDKCIPDFWVCDDYEDCLEGEDEAECDSVTKPATTTNVVRKDTTVDDAITTIQETDTATTSNVVSEQSTIDYAFTTIQETYTATTSNVVSEQSTVYYAFNTIQGPYTATTLNVVSEQSTVDYAFTTIQETDPATTSSAVSEETTVYSMFTTNNVKGINTESETEKATMSESGMNGITPNDSNSTKAVTKQATSPTVVTNRTYADGFRSTDTKDIIITSESNTGETTDPNSAYLFLPSLSITFLLSYMVSAVTCNSSI